MTNQATAAPAPSGRGRIILMIVVTMLLVLLAVLIYVFYTLLKPQGLPGEADVDNTPTDLVWVRSLYGFGPSADEQLQTPTSVAIAPNGDVYATDPTRARVMVFRPDGTFKRLLHTGAGGTAPGQFIRPESIDVDDDGNVYIADSWARKVIVFNDAGRFVREFVVDQQARGVHVAGDKVYVLDVGRVLVFDRSGKRLTMFGSRGPKVGQIDAYQGVAVRDGDIFIADSYNKRIQRFDESGSVSWAVPGGTASRKGPEARQATGSDESASQAVPNHRWDLPQDVVFDGAGRLIVVDAFQFEIAAVNPKTGKVQARHGTYGSDDGQMFYPSSIDYDARRDWFAVANTQNNRIQIVRIPNSGGAPMGAVWRALSSPFRYLLVPAALLLFAAVVGVWTARRLSKKAVTTDTLLNVSP